MLTRLVTSACALTLLHVLTPALALEPDRSPSTPSESAADLVREALQAEMAGDNALRSQLLAKAREMAPDFAPARWHSGQIQHQAAWYSIEELAQDPTHSGRVATYRQMREQLAGTLQGHTALAEWCRKNELPDQERLHWLAVLQHDFDNELARSRLKLLEHNGVLVTREDLQRYKEFVERSKENQRKWKPRAKQWREALTGDDQTIRQKAEEELQQLADVEAVPFLEQILAPDNQSCSLLVVDVLGRIDQQAATDALVRFAVLSPFPAVRHAAAQQLSERSIYGYMPTLLGSLSAPIEFYYYVDTWLSDAICGYQVVQEGPNAVFALSRQHRWQVFQGNNRTRGSAITVAMRNQRVLWAANTGLALGQELEARVVQVNAAAEARNQRIFEVLEQAAGQQLERRPQAWWQWWQDQNELQSSPQKPVYQIDLGTQRIPIPYDCFMPGTLVWTDTGAVPIESIHVGDRVLAQDPESGEVGYKLVVNTTLRQRSPTLRVGLGDEEIVSTLGHPMWVVGKGWQMAKQLKAGDRLHAPDGSCLVQYVEPGPESPAYSLAVADFHTYTVGTRRILVHDNMMHRPTRNLVPGLAAK